jgi:hypothetical protein
VIHEADDGVVGGALADDEAVARIATHARADGGVVTL